MDRFGLLNITKNYDYLFRDMNLDILSPIINDTRVRSERNKYFEEKLKSLDKKTIEELKGMVVDARDPDALMILKEDIEVSLIKFIRFYDLLEDLNSEESRKIALKEKELKLDARYDWREKARLFLF